MFNPNIRKWSLHPRTVQLTCYLSVIMLLVVSCSNLDDAKIPKEAYSKVVIDNFDINTDRDFIGGRIVNNSSRVVTSCKFEFRLYRHTEQAELVKGKQPGSDNFGRDNQDEFREYSSSDSLSGMQLLISENFLVRESLKPGYSTEFYFELTMDFDFHSYAYSKEIIQLKGR